MNQQHDFASLLHLDNYFIIDDFLPPHHFQALQTLIKTNYQQGCFRSAKIGKNAQTSQNKNIRNDQIYWLDEHSDNKSLDAYFGSIDAIRHSLNQALYLGLINFEAHFAVYKPGTFYKKHIDQFATTKDRRLSCVYYLNDDWLESFGGELIFYDKNDKFLKTIHPFGNRLVCFCSELAHEVRPTRQMRYSITGWLKTRSLES